MNATKTPPTEGEFEWVAEGLVRRKSSGILYTRFRHDGKLVRRSLRTKDRQTAKSRLRRLRSDLDRGVTTLGSRSTPADRRGALLLSELISRYNKIFAAKADSTAKRAADYSGNLEAFLGGARKVGDIRTSEIELWLANAGEGMKGSTKNEQLRVARQIFDIAVRDGDLESSPAHGINWWKREDPERPTPSQEEVEKMLAAIRSHPKANVRSESGDTVEFMAYAGMGQAECRYLLWGNVDLEEGMMAIKRKKTQKRYKVPINPRVEKLLRRRFGDGKPRTDRVFSVAEPKKALNFATKIEGLPHYSPRALRRFFCRTALRLGVDPTTVGHWQGHSDGTLILEIYGSSEDEEHSKRMAQRFA